MKNSTVIAILMVGLAAAPLAAQTKTHRAVRRATRAPVAHSLYRPSSLNLKAPAVYRAKFVTTQGNFVVEVTRTWAPLGADRFYNLVKFGFYNGASFFRVLPGFVAQFGLSATPRISQIWSKAPIKDDLVVQDNTLGTLSFATAGPETRTTQVFINLGDNTRLGSSGFSPFGKIVEGMEVVEKLYSGYGEGAPMGSGPDQGRLESEGHTYLEKNFPKLDSIKSAIILPTAPPASNKPPARKTVRRTAVKAGS